MKLPKLLAGPILRRVEPKEAIIWIAMSDYYDIYADLYEVKLTSFMGKYEYKPVPVKTETQTIRLGKKLIVYLIRISPINDTFPMEKFLGYNLHFVKGTEKLDLGSFGLLSYDNPFSIVYHQLSFPTFFISEKENTKLFGSCRKLHGKGEDSLAGGDIKLRDSFFNIQERPGSLFLLGDQIYADDVADPITPFIKVLAEEITGGKEDLSAVDERLNTEHFQKALEQTHGRQFIMEKFCKFTSNNAHNHLMSFGEFAAMYLLSYSPELWIFANEEGFILPFEEMVQKGEFYFIYPNERGYEEHFTQEFIDHKTRYYEQIENLQQFQESLPRIRRLLANIPSYMIFDDHDITDDWNISLEWKENVENSHLGKHVIANGLAAYWVFQGWGNNPEQFDYSFLKKMQKYMRSFDVLSPSYKSWVESLLSFEKWSFVAPTIPKALFLDTRTKRAFNLIPKPVQVGKLVKEITAGPQLISKEGWDIVNNQLQASDWKKGESLIIVSPTPLYGIRLIESFLRQFVLPLKLFRLPVQTAFDLEGWRFNGRGYHLFHHWISEWNPESCVILSGDAHMASFIETEVSIQNGEKRKLHQFTSSPMKNDSFSALTELFLKGFLRLHSWTSGHNELHRSCDLSFNLTYELDSTQEARLWKEHIKYLSLPNGSIVETDNNLGLLNEAKRLLKYQNHQIQEKDFER